jgi:hypothetical protein
VQPSSLVFLVLIAIWAAYLLQHWVRRREYLATARSVDRFSEAMRVLERRTALPQLDVSVPRTPSYAMSASRPLRRAVTTEPSPGVRPTRIFRILARVSARRMRGLSLLATLSLVLVAVPLAACSVLPWWSLLVVLVVLVADLGLLRHTARSGRTSIRADAHTVRSAPAARQANYFDPESDVGSDSELEIERRSEPQIYSEFERLAASVAGPADIPQPVEPVFDADPSGWAPVPVPPPTYTLKAKAADPVVVPAALPEPLAGEPWSLDGLYYDCELEELVEHRSATGA